MRARWGWACAFAALACGGPDHPSSSATAGGEGLGDAYAYADVVVGRGSGRAADYALRFEEPAEELESARSIARPGEIDVLIGRPGDGRELSEAELAREVLSGWELEEELDDEGRPRRTPARTLHVVADVPYESFTGEGTWVHVLALSPDFRPAPNAEVFLDGRLVGLTEEHGTLVFRRRPSDVERAEGTLRVRWRGMEREVAYEASLRTDSFEQRTIYAYTDRGVIEPGQSVRVRAIAWRLRGEYRPLASARLDLALIDPRGRIVGGGVLVTDRFGVGATTLAIPLHAAEGPYSITASSGEESARSRLIVQRFVAPAIEMQHDLPRFLTPRAAPLATEVRLGYFDGGPFGHATLRLIAKVDDVERARASVEVDGAGPHRVVLDEAAMRQVRAAARPGRPIELDLEVTDQSGRSDVVRRFVEYETNPYRASIELDRTRYAAGEPVNAMVRLVDLDGVPVRDRAVALDLPAGRPAGWRGTEAEIERAYERDGEGARRRLTGRTDTGGVARFRFPMPRMSEDFDDPALYAHVDDVADPIAESELPLAEPLPMRSAVDGTVVREGQDVDVEIVFPRDARPLERVVHADIVDSSGAIIHSALVPIAGNVARGRVRAPSWGSMLLTLFCVGRRGSDIGLMTDGQNLVVHPGQRLRVELQGLPASAAPGAHVGADVIVQSADGQPREASIGASVVDAAVLSLLDPLERPPFDRFYNPDRKVLASTGAQTLTWPVVARTWGLERYDIGWPAAFGWHTGVMPRLRRMARMAPPSPFGGGGDALGGLELDGGGGAGQGTIGLGNLGTIGHGAGGGTGSGYGRGAGALAEPEEPEPAAPQIILRTRFDETALWIPDLVAENGRAHFEVDLPDAITAQRFGVVASDAEGGIATAHVDLPVRQELFVRSDLPPALTEGDRLSVQIAGRNLGAQNRDLQLQLRSEDLTVTGDPSRVAIPPNGTRAAAFEVLASHPGPATYEVIGRAEGFEDVERRTLWVRPAGEPIVIDSRGVASAGAPFVTRFTLDPSDRHHVVSLGVTMPSAMPALQGLERLIGEGYFGPDPAASRVLAATAALAYLDRTGQLERAARERLVGWMAELSSSILMAQGADGGWGWFWSAGASNPLITGFALHALIELRAIGLPVPERALELARNYLLGQIAQDGLFDASDIAVWEGGGERERRQVSAEILDALSRLPPRLRADPRIAQLAATLAPELDRASPDPLALALVTGALHRLGHDPAIPDLQSRLQSATRRLARIGELAHWEPGWFHAWGGRVEAAAVALEVLHATDDPAYEAAQRDAVRLLLHTQRSFGAWHNARSTAWAIRALTLVDPGVPGDRGAIVVRVDGREAHRVAVDASDRMASALALRSIEIAELGPGAHEVEVSYDGRMQPRVELRVERWAREDAPAAAREPASDLSLSMSAPAEARRGAPFEVRLEASGTRVGPHVVDLALPAGLHVAPRALDRLRETRAILDAIEVGASVRLGLAPGATHAITITLVADHAGELALPAARLSSALLPDRAAASRAARVTVR